MYGGTRLPSHIFFYDFAAITYLQFFIDIMCMFFNGINRNIKLNRNFFVKKSFNNK